ncbi:hypothetical protein ACOME3_003361 [Neoechinorhynchus agilis]
MMLKLFDAYTKARREVKQVKEADTTAEKKLTHNFFTYRNFKAILKEYEKLDKDRDGFIERDEILKLVSEFNFDD